MNIVARIKFSGLMKVSTAQSATILILTVVANAKKREREWKKQHLKLPRWTVLRKKT